MPGAEQISAPAFIVLLFESSFQADGDPSAAQRIMLAGLAAVFVGTFTASVLTQIAWQQRVRRLGASTVASGVENRQVSEKRTWADSSNATDRCLAPVTQAPLKYVSLRAMMHFQQAKIFNPGFSTRGMG